MFTRNRDSKFIIYQVLYIFVITVLALKGADLNLRQVINKDKSVNINVRDSLVTLINSLYAQGKILDVKINPIKEENRELKKKVKEINKKYEELSTQISTSSRKESDLKVEKSNPKEQTILQSPISLALTFIQYTWNKAKNNGNVITQIYDPKNMNKPLVVIPPGKEMIFNLSDQTEVIAKYGNQEQRIKVVPNKLPKVLIQKTTTKMNDSDIYVLELQKVTAFNVIISDDRPEQLKVTYRGPISVKGPFKNQDGNLVYNVSLNLSPTEELFSKWVDRFGDASETNGRYKVNFFFSITDTISKAHIEVGDSFYFTEYSR